MQSYGNDKYLEKVEGYARAVRRAQDEYVCQEAQVMGLELWVEPRPWAFDRKLPCAYYLDRKYCLMDLEGECPSVRNIDDVAEGCFLVHPSGQGWEGDGIVFDTVRQALNFLVKLKELELQRPVQI